MPLFSFYLMTEEHPIVFRAILEVLGKPKEHVETTIKSLVNQIKSIGGYTLKESFISDAKPHEHLFSSFAELELRADSLSKVIGFCFDFMPSSVEILEPDKLVLTAGDMSDFLTDLQAKLHKGDMVTKKLNSVNFFMRKNLNALMRNYVQLALRGGEKSLATLSKLSGISEKDLAEFLDVLIKDNLVVKTDSGYRIKNG